MNESRQLTFEAIEPSRGPMKFYAPAQWSSIPGVFAAVGSDERIARQRSGSKGADDPHESPESRRRKAISKTVYADLFTKEGDPYRLQIGAFSPFEELDPAGKEATAKENPVFDVSMFHLLGVELYLLGVEPGKAAPAPRDLSLRDIARVYSVAGDSDARIRVAALHMRLSNVLWRIGTPDGHGGFRWHKAQRIFEGEAIDNDYIEVWNSKEKELKRAAKSYLRGLSFAPAFLDALLPCWSTAVRDGDSGFRQERLLQEIRLEGLARARSPVAKLFYLYFPKIASMRSEDRPFEIGSVAALDQLGVVGITAYKADRVFLGHQMDGTSGIIGDLDGAELLKGKLRLAFGKSREDGKGRVIRIWSDGRKQSADAKEKKDGLADAAGLRNDSFRERVRNAPALDEEHQRLLQRAGLSSDDIDRRFDVELRRARVLLGDDNFRSVLRDMDLEAFRLRGGRISRSPGARVRFYIRERVREVFSARKPS